MPRRPTTTRTLNPLPFEHLEPKRFEDLIRQLLYDFRRWRKLEATGRAGSDGGFDARGWEVIGSSENDSSVEPDDDDEGDSQDRLWLIQCKRERKLTPKKMQQYLDEIDGSSRMGLYGIVFAAAADFSKATRDTLATWCATHGIAEWMIWGKAEIEDLLFQPKNDHLLFAYFGISLQIRRRSSRAIIRSIVTTKRKLKSRLESRGHNLPVVIRDPTDDRYPITDRSVPVEKRDHRWRVFSSGDVTHKGLTLTVARFFAFVDDDGVSWDIADAHNDGRVHKFDNPWGEDDDHDLRRQIREYWETLPEKNRCFVTVVAYLPLGIILEVDEIGDDITDHPHIFIDWPHGPPPLDGFYFEFPDSFPKAGDESLRIAKFPIEFRRPSCD